MIKDLRYLLLIAALIFAYGSFTLLQSCSSDEPLYLIWTAISYISVAGLLLKKQWSKYLVYVFSLILVGGWAVFIFYIASSEILNQQQYISRLLVLGAVLATISLASSIYVYKYFKPNSNNSNAYGKI